ncbi:MAG: hypothetical protein VW378_06985 [bacterium]
MLDLYINIKNAYFAMEGALRVAITNSHQYNTPGFKYSFPVFTTMYERALTSGTESQNPVNLGSSVSLGAVTRDFGQGSIVTGTQFDAAINGEGFFVIADVSQVQYGGAISYVYTRNGRFRKQPHSGYMVDMFGRVVFGYKIDEKGQTSTELVPIQLNDTVDIGFLDGGILASNYERAKENPEESATPLYRLALTTFQNKQGLGSSDGASFSATAASGENTGFGYSDTKISGTNARYGKVLGAQFESSNVDIARINLDLNVLNRGTTAVQGVMDDLGKTLSGFINKL